MRTVFTLAAVFDLRRRRRRSKSRRPGLEPLERRAMLAGVTADPNTAWVKFDLSNLDQTGVTPASDIYLQGYANASGQILQYDASLDKLVLTKPLPLPITFEPTSLGYVGTSPNAVTLSTTATLIVGAQVTATKADGSRFQSIVTSITANATASSWNGSAWVAPGTGGWTVGANAALQTQSVLTTGTLTDAGSTSTLTGATVAQAASAGLSLGVLAVGTIPGKPSNSYFFPATSDGRPFPKSGSPAMATRLVQNGAALTATFSAATGKGSVSLATDFLSFFRGGTNGSGFATLSAYGPATATGVPVAVGNLLSTGQIVPANVTNPTAPQINTYMVLSGVSGNVPIKSVESFTITLADPVPLDAGGKPVALTFATSVTGSVTGGASFTIDATTYPGIAAALGIGQKPTLSVGGAQVSNLAISGLQQVGSTITVTLSGSMPWTSGPVTVALPPTGGPLPTYKWDPSNAARNAIWAPQTTTADKSPAVNGARLYFSLVKPGAAPPAMEFSVANGVASVTQFDPTQIWQGQVAPSQYVELTADSLGTSGLPTNEGKVYVDLSAVDGFFFPAALSTTVGGKSLQMGQPAGPYQDPGNGPVPSYNAVARDEILGAWQAFFGDTTRFAAGADALRQAYADLRIVNDGQPIGIQNPSFIWSMPSHSVATTTALDHAWDAHLDVLFSGSGQVDLMGDQTSLVRSFVNAVQVGRPGTGYLATDTVTFSAPVHGGRPATGTIQVSTGGVLVGLTITDPGNYGLTETPTIQIHSSTGSAGSFTVAAMVPAQTYYKGVPTAVNSHAALALAEYVGPPVALAQTNHWTLSYEPSSATGAVFTVYDPRNPPQTEPQAFSQSGSALDVGYQILANAGVFSSTGINTGNYSHGASDPWNGNASAELTQLKALERDIVTALNQGIGGTLRGATVPAGPASTAAYWATETNWYPYPSVSGGTYPLATPQNLYSQWVHTAVIDEPARKYYATYPFGAESEYGVPATSASGQLMNMTYGFGYDESPAHGFPGPNVPSKFLPIVNTAGNENAPLTFQLRFGPWASAERPAIDLNGDGIGDVIWRKVDGTGAAKGYVGWIYDAAGNVVSKRGLAQGGEWSLETAAYFTTGPVTDLLWRNTATNATTMWIMNADGTTARQKYIGGKDSPEWQVETSGDYDGDGDTDLIWRNSTNYQHSMWLMNTWHVTGQAVIGGSSTFRLVATAADYDANDDGCIDLIWRDTTTDGHVVHLMQGTKRIGAFAVADGTGWDLVATGNFDTNGIGDLLWRQQSTGAVVQWLMTYDAASGTGKPRKETPLSTGTTKAPLQTLSYWGNAIAWRRPADGSYAVWKMLGSTVASKTPTIGGTTTFELVRRHPVATS